MVTVLNNVNFHLWEAHKDDFFSVPEDNPLEELIQTAEEFANPDSDPEQAAMIFICKRLRLNYRKLTDEEKKALKKIAEKSDLLKNPDLHWGRTRRLRKRQIGIGGYYNGAHERLFQAT